VILVFFLLLCTRRGSVGREGDEAGDDELAAATVAEGEFDEIREGVRPPI